MDFISTQGARDKIALDVSRILEQDAECLRVINGSCLGYFAQMWPDAPLLREAGTAHAQDFTTIYYAAPYKNIEQNSGVAGFLGEHGINVILPYEDVLRKTGSASPDDHNLVRDVCIEAINRADGIVVDIDHYGLDTAWELGYAEGLGKYIFGLNHDVSLRNNARPINRRSYKENFMHGWTSQKIYSDIESVRGLLSGKTIYTCGSFSNAHIEEVKSGLKGYAKRVIFPKDYLPENQGFPSDYPLRTRADAINQLEQSDVIIVALPRCGMDSSWQTGYATAKNKTIVGVLLPDDGKNSDSKTPWDHWMHGWHEKDMLTGRAKLAATIVSYLTFDIIK